MLSLRLQGLCESTSGKQCKMGGSQSRRLHQRIGLALEIVKDVGAYGPVGPLALAEKGIIGGQGHDVDLFSPIPPGAYPFWQKRQIALSDLIRHPLSADVFEWRAEEGA